MSGQNLVKGTAWAGNFSRFSYDDAKSYVMLLKEQGTYILDDDFNFLQLAHLAQFRKFVKAIIGDVSPDNGFNVAGTGATNDFTIKAGNILTDGWLVNVAADTAYSAQLVAQSGLTTPVANRTDLVYLDVWTDEINSTQDAVILDPTLQVRTSTRLKLFWAVKVAEGAAIPAGGLDANNLYHWRLQIAQINRLAGNATITAAMVIDMRAGLPNKKPRTLVTGTTLLTTETTVYLNPADGATETFHLPTYVSIPTAKQYRLKNVGAGTAIIDTTDATTIDNIANVTLIPGDKCTVDADGTNWQTF